MKNTLQDLRNEFPCNFKYVNARISTFKYLLISLSILISNGVFHNYYGYIDYITPSLYFASIIGSFSLTIILLAMLEDEEIDEQQNINKVYQTDNTNWTEVKYFIEKITEKLTNPINQTIENIKNFKNFFSSDHEYYPHLEKLIHLYNDFEHTLDQLREQTNRLSQISSTVNFQILHDLHRLNTQMNDYFELLQKAAIINPRQYNVPELVKLLEEYQDSETIFGTLASVNHSNN